jgi:molybdate transport system permease protein
MTAMLAPLLISLKVATFATAFALVVGVATAFVLARVKLPGKDLMDAFLTLPLVLPPTIIGYYLIVVIGRNGFIGRWLEDTLGVSLIFTWQGAVVAAAIVSLPLVLKSARAAFEGVPPELEDAARTLGKSEGAVFFLVTLPLAWRGILAGAMLAFARAMGEFGATLMVAGNLPGRTQTISMAVYDAAQSGDDRLGLMLVLLTSVVCVAILVASGRLLKAPWSRPL